MTQTQTVLGALAVLVVIMVPVITALWRFAAKVNDNTAAVNHLSATVEGNASALGLNARVRSLEDWRTASEAVKQAEAAAAAAGQLRPPAA